MCRSLVKVLSNRERASEEVDPVALLIYAVQGGGEGTRYVLRCPKGGRGMLNQDCPRG